MTEILSPSEKRAEAYRNRVVRIGGENLSTQELIEAARAVEKVAGRVIKSDAKFVEETREELEKKKTA